MCQVLQTHIVHVGVANYLPNFEVVTILAIVPQSCSQLAHARLEMTKFVIFLVTLDIWEAQSQSKPDSKRKQKRDLYQSFQPEVTNVTFVTVTIGHNRSHCLKSVTPVFKSFF